MLLGEINMVNVYSYCTVLSLMFLFITLYFIKRRLLSAQYSLLWILVSVIMIILSLNKSIIEWVADFVNIKYPPAFLFLMGILFCFSLILKMTLIISDSQDKITRLTQEIAIIKSKNTR